ncbi:F-box/kelch-repeat protein [Cardamine amara subsp. amara]|uniref:F-box/kelch-repeat protein n=1 Tax=Cardamine amara subsp. amara TaxID=228776 RepID=A0ABD0ZAX7_CARAN
MTTPYLPMDLVEEIVCRVPLKSMRALRLTCKGLYTLSKTPRFMKKIGATREGETGMIVLMDYNLYLVSVVVKGDFSAELKGKLTCLNDSDQVKISKVFHCEGLVLCILKDDTRFVVWNPYCGETKWIKPRYSYDRCQERFCYALGYVNKKFCRSHKLLRFIDYYKHISGIQSICYEIYDFDTDLWTNLAVTPHWRISSNNLGVSLKGNTYWCASERPPSGHDRFNNHLICFDFTKESFGPLMPLPFSPKYKDFVTLSCVKEEKLSALLQRFEPDPCEVEIWITTKIEAKKVSWNKFLIVDMRLGISYKLESFFIDEEKKVAMSFDKTFNCYVVNIIGEAGYFEQVDLRKSGDNNYRPCACAFVPSLMQIKQPERGQRKDQSILEKRPFDQNKLRALRLAYFTKA